MIKSKLRSKILKIRKTNSYKQYKINCKKLFSFLNRREFNLKIIGGYYPYNYEIDDLETLFFFRNKKINIALPIIKKNNQMDFFKWSINNPLKINKYGIAEPVSSKILLPDLLFVPLVGYDQDLNRLGYGGGFYDRYIDKAEKRKKIVKVGLAFSYQKVKKIPVISHDKKLDLIITEKGILS